MAEQGEPAVRAARAEDLVRVAEIVNHYILHSHVNFRTQPQGAQQWEEAWRRWRERYPWLVATLGETVRGIAYATPYKEREAYDWCAEVTVYVDIHAQRRGIASALYRELVPLLDALGFRSQLAVIALPNPASVALHEAFGFRPVGVMERVGFKRGDWYDVGIWQRIPGRAGGAPEPTRRLDGAEPL